MCSNICLWKTLIKKHNKNVDYEEAVIRDNIQEFHLRHLAESGEDIVGASIIVDEYWTA